MPAFEPPEWKNARTTLTWMVGLLVTLFVGLTVVIHLDGLVPKSNQTLLSQLAHTQLGGGVLYGFVQAATALILLFAANTSFNGFPRLLYYMARNQHAPSAFLRMGDRFAFSNGIIMLAVAAAAIFAAFHGNTQSLIPLYAVGVFLVVTLSQTGMVGRALVAQTRRSSAPQPRRQRARGRPRCARARDRSGDEVHRGRLGRRGQHPDRRLPLRPRPRALRQGPRGAHAATAAGWRSGQSAAPRRRTTTAAPPCPRARSARRHPTRSSTSWSCRSSRLDFANLRALAYAALLAQPLLAVHISPETTRRPRFRHDWESFDVPLRYEVVVSPYRALVAPLAHYVEALHLQRPGLTTTVIIAELVVRHPWQRLLHSQVDLRLRLVLRT